MTIFFIFWSVFYCIIHQVVTPRCANEPIKIKRIINDLVVGNYHLWFMYLIVGLYLIVPLLRLWVKDENKKYVEYFIILSIVFVYIYNMLLQLAKTLAIYLKEQMIS